MKSSARLVAAAILMTCATFVPAHAVLPDEVLQDVTLETRARVISQLLRCVVCQNQSIDDSSAPLARDLRILVRQRLTTGDTDDQATAFIVARYGNFVLLKPPLQWNTLLLWAGPALLLALSFAAGWRLVRFSASRSPGASEIHLSTEDDARAELLLSPNQPDAL